MDNKIDILTVYSKYIQNAEDELKRIPLANRHERNQIKNEINKYKQLYELHKANQRFHD